MQVSDLRGLHVRSGLLFFELSFPACCFIWIEMLCSAAIANTDAGIDHCQWIAFYFCVVFRKNVFQNRALATLLTLVAKCNRLHIYSPFVEVLILVHEQ